MSATDGAPELITSQWLNAGESQTLAMHRGKVVVVEVFQMLCPGCVSHSLPQAQRVHQIFPKDDVAVLGLHSVFEHHDAMTPVSLKAFLYEYGISFPVGVDAHEKGQGLPLTMAAYGMRGTPTLLLVARDGTLAAHQFGQVSDLDLGAKIATLMARPAPETLAQDNLAQEIGSAAASGCAPDACPVETT